MTARRGTGAELEALRAQVAGLAAEAERIAEAFAAIRGMVAIEAAAWQDGFDKGQASARPAAPVRATRDRRGLRLVDGTPGGAA